MTANIITLMRIPLSFLTIALFYGGIELRITAVVLTIVIILMDSLDGFIARLLGQASDFGALLDIAGDRIVENVYWVFFTAIGLVSLWVPIIYISRGFLVDTLRTAAHVKEGKTPFGEKSMMRSRLTYFLTASRASRAIYGTGKAIVFVILGLILVFEKVPPSMNQRFPQNFSATLMLFANFLVWLVVAMNLIRGVPVLWDGRHYLFDSEIPTQQKGES